MKLLLAPDSAGGAAAVANPPPSTPAAAPTAPKSGDGSPPTPPAPPSGPVVGENMFAELDAMATPPKPEPKKPAAEPKSEPKKADEPKKPDAAAPKAPDDKTFSGPKQLREAHDRAVKRAADAESKIAEYERRIAAAEEKGKSTETLNLRLSEMQKQLEDANKRIYALDVGETPDFKEKYVKPFNETAEYARQIVERMEVNTLDADGQVTSTRAASWENDFAPIYQLAAKSITKATQEAKRLFGDDYQTVMNHVQELQRLDHMKHKAFDELKKNAEADRQKQVQEQSSQRDWVDKSWREVNADIADKNPTIFQPDPQDKQRAELWNKSIALVDSQRKALTPIQRITLDANIRLRAAAFPVLKYDIEKLRQRVEELEGAEAERKDSKPGSTQRPSGDSQPAPEKSFNQELQELEA